MNYNYHIEIPRAYTSYNWKFEAPWGFPGATSGEEPASANAGDIKDTGSIPVLGRSLKEGTLNHSSILPRIYGQMSLMATIHRL